MQIQLREEWVWGCSGDGQRNTGPNGDRRIVAEHANVLRKDVLGEWEKGLVGQRDKKRESEPKHAKDFVMSTVCSCRDGIPGRWRTQLDLCSRKSFDDQHRTTAVGASPKIAGTGGGDLLLGLWC